MLCFREPVETPGDSSDVSGSEGIRRAVSGHESDLEGEKGGIISIKDRFPELILATGKFKLNGRT